CKTRYCWFDYSTFLSLLKESGTKAAFLCTRFSILFGNSFAAAWHAHPEQTQCKQAECGRFRHAAQAAHTGHPAADAEAAQQHLDIEAARRPLSCENCVRNLYRIRHVGKAEGIHPLAAVIGSEKQVLQSSCKC